MPRFDGTGPNGMGQMTGRERGPCTDGMRRRFGRNFGMQMGFCPWVQKPLTKDEEKKMIQDEIKQLEEYLKELKKRLE